MDSLTKLFGEGGMLYTGGGESPGVVAKLDAGKGDPDFAEKGSILGMTPSTFASVAGQLGSAITPKGSWQNQLGGLAAQMGSQKLNQLLQAEKEKRATDLYKQMLGVMSNKQLTSFTPAQPGAATGSITGIKPLSLETPSLDINPEFRK